MRVLPELFGDQLRPEYDCLVGSGIYLPYIQSAEASGVSTTCINPGGVNIVTCQDERVSSFLAEVQGLGFDIAPANQVKISEHYIPVFDYRTIELATHSASAVIGLTLVDILVNPITEVAGKKLAKKIIFRDAAKIRSVCSQKKVILFLTGMDVLIETVWHQRDACALFQQLQEMAFWAVTGFNFSVFGGECPFAQRLNQKKSLVSSILLEEHGLLSIPHVYAVNDFHIAAYQDWLKRNPQIQLITMNCQMQHSKKDIEQIVRSVQAMLLINDNLHVILQGFWFSELHGFGEFQKRIHIAESMPVKYGQSFRSVNPALISKPGQYIKDDYKKLVFENLDYRRTALEDLLYKRL